MININININIKSVLLTLCVLSGYFSLHAQEEPVVDVGYGINISAKESTAAVSVINANDLMKSSAANPANALFGEATGLGILQNGGTVWENSPTMYIRGIGSLEGNNNILVIVDGFERPLDMLVREEIESVQVLKDAVATALYGLKGANGVLLVKTKKGKYEDMSISFSYDHAFNKPIRLPKYVNAATYAQGVNEALRYDGLPERYNNYELNAFRQGNNPYYEDVDWVNKTLSDNGVSNIYTMTIRGGGKTARYFSVLNYFHNSGYILPDNQIKEYSSQLKYAKVNLRTNIDVDITKKTAFAVRLLGTLAEHNRPGIQANELMTLLNSVPAAAFPIKTPEGEWGADNVWTQNPVAEIVARGAAQSHARTLLADMELKQQLDLFTPGLSAEAHIGFDNSADYWENNSTGYTTRINQVIFDNSGQPIDVLTKTKEGASPAYSSDLGNQWRSFNLVGKINYSRTWEQWKMESSLFASKEQTVWLTQNHTYDRNNYGLFIHTGFKDKYFADVAFSANASNLLPKENHFGYFPAFSTAWLISNESFMKKFSYINLLKMRASWGIAGYDYTPSPNLWMQLYGNDRNYWFKDSYMQYDGIGEYRMATQNMSYEKSYKSNIGLNISLFNHLSITMDAFLEKRRDILIPSANEVSTVMGLLELPYRNAGKVDNKGFEAGLDFRQEIKNGSYHIGGKFSFSRNKILEMGEAYVPYDYYKLTGKAVGQIFGYEATGFFKDEEDIANSLPQYLSSVRPGDVKYKNQNDDNLINQYDQKAIGYNAICPEIYYSFNLGFEYKGFGIEALFQGAGNYSVMMNIPGRDWVLRGNTNISQYQYDNRWTVDNPNAKYPRLTTLSNANNFTNSTIWLADRSFLKLRHCDLYYQLPASLIKQVKIKTAKLYLRTMDLIVMDHINIADPEVCGATYPASYSFHIGLAVGF